MITVRGKSLIESADVIVTDALVNPALLRFARARIHYVGKRGAGARQKTEPSVSQAKINSLLVREAKNGNRVVRLKGGDPIVFGRGSEEMKILKKSRIPYEIIPGITSPIAVPAYAGIPVTDRRWASHVTFLTGQESQNPSLDSSPVKWSSLPKGGTLVILMGVANWKRIQIKLLNASWNPKTNVAAIESGTTRDQRVIRTNLKSSFNDFKKTKIIPPLLLSSLEK